MAGTTRSDVLTKQPFNFHFGDVLHSNTGTSALVQHGKFSLSNERDYYGFGSKFIHNYDTWNSFGAKYIENNNMTCLKSELEESVANGDRGLRFVNGFAAQMRHNKVAADSSDESDDNNLSNYEIDSNVESTPSLCSTKSCQRSVSSLESCSGSDLSDSDSPKSHASAMSVASIPRSGSLRMSSNDTALLHSNNNIELKATNMAYAGSRSTISAEDTVYKDCVETLDTQQHLDVNGNRIENSANPSLIEAFQDLPSNGEMDQNHCGNSDTFLGMNGVCNTLLKPYDKCQSNTETVQGWLDKQDTEQVQGHVEENEKKQITRDVANGCNCRTEQDIYHSTFKKSRKGKKRRKREYEVELICNDVRGKRTILNGHSKKTKDQFQRWKSSRQERHRKTIRRVNSGTKSKIRRKLSLQRISETDAKKMIKELKKTLKRVSEEIEELKKLTRKSKKKKPKKVSRKASKGSANVSNSTTASLAVENHRMERRSYPTKPPDPYRYVPKQRFTFHGVLPSPPSLVVRNGILEPTFSMAIARGSVPPKKHPIWSWKLGNPPLPGTRTTSSKNNGTD
ncbi:hypothetical protein HOLleu_34966 [Holothuria leucospilota]|uniref:Uncharacterized protein n=1 Tax=Holothuria leucospilota TaxID=206669 RepID=A0A9Q0YRB5_HOLLE|nr:hypothetical protein HOLleu_34966 [Holothuria leucospilota]